MVVAPSSRTVLRSTAMDFSTQPYYIEYITTLFKSPGRESKVMILVKPFRAEVWSLIVVSVPIAALATFLFGRVLLIGSNESGNAAGPYRQFGYCLMVTFGALLARGRPCLILFVP